jgi:hypothetical protein
MFYLLLFVAMLVRDISLPVTVFGLPLHAYRIDAMLRCCYAMLYYCYAILYYRYAMPCLFMLSLCHAMFMFD